MLSKEDIIKLKKEQIIAAGDVLGRALMDDPVSVYDIPDKEKRHAVMKHIFQMTSCLGVKFGETHATSTNLEGIAVWLPYINKQYKRIVNIGCLLKAKVYKLGTQASKRIKPIEEHSTKVHLEFAPDDHWYLQTLGVEPTHQGKGYGSLLMGYMLEKIDNTNPLPVFLETSTEINVKFYKRFGFEVVIEEIVPSTNVKQWYLLRDAK
ncbi:MAG: GNAT family N-acetyltransferase [Candidatus Lokiarchaeota archaeon]|nr:GNAT family N-acetyltransferase [Candidatus Lokiarchaeota archaeon]